MNVIDIVNLHGYIRIISRQNNFLSIFPPLHQCHRKGEDLTQKHCTAAGHIHQVTRRDFDDRNLPRRKRKRQRRRKRDQTRDHVQKPFPLSKALETLVLVWLGCSCSKVINLLSKASRKIIGSRKSTNPK